MGRMLMPGRLECRRGTARAPRASCPARPWCGRARSCSRRVGVARPHLGAVDPVAALHALGAGADARPGPSPSRARSCRWRRRARRARSAAGSAARCSSVPKRRSSGPALAVRHPVRGDRRARREHLLEHDVALERRALVAAVLLRPRHADPAARAHLQAELAVVAAPGPRALVGRALAHRLAQELAHLARAASPPPAAAPAARN